MQTETTFAMFVFGLPSDLVKKTSQSAIETVYKSLQEDLTHKIKEDALKYERRLKRKMDDFRYDLKKVRPSITIDSQWETVKSLTSHLQSYDDLEEENRIEAFEKYKKRLEVSLSSHFDLHHILRRRKEDQALMTNMDRVEKEKEGMTRMFLEIQRKRKRIESTRHTLELKKVNVVIKNQ